MAVTEALWLAGMTPAAAANEAEAAPLSTVTEAGTPRSALLLASDTTTLPAGAALLKVTVQLLAEFEISVLGLQTNDDTRAGAIRLMVAGAELLL